MNNVKTYRIEILNALITTKVLRLATSEEALRKQMQEDYPGINYFYEEVIS